MEKLKIFQSFIAVSLVVLILLFLGNVFAHSYTLKSTERCIEYGQILELHAEYLDYECKVELPTGDFVSLRSYIALKGINK